MDTGNSRPPEVAVGGFTFGPSGWMTLPGKRIHLPNIDQKSEDCTGLDERIGVF